MATRNRVNAKAAPRTTDGPQPEPSAAESHPRGIQVASRRRPPLGQNFLADRGAAERIVAALGEISNTTVLEIGPGRGVLTDLLARRAGALVAIELDRVLAAQLRMRYAARASVEIIEGDI